MTLVKFLQEHKLQKNSSVNENLCTNAILMKEKRWLGNVDFQ